ncbi:hypothetical protein DEO72_LG2g2964 [Vigna unguiculata]|uniref:Uncharacterized protein n=1 Tax=Vigna unguiculata TaxID=3917 RepID=A0A4D6L2F0_VIGUN|nr:hypothetical protein DEO72_LG2g2964 [Vigna unguiculata]
MSLVVVMRLTVFKEVVEVDLEVAQMDMDSGVRVRDRVRFGDLGDNVVGEGESIMEGIRSWEVYMIKAFVGGVEKLVSNSGMHHDNFQE